MAFVSSIDTVICQLQSNLEAIPSDESLPPSAKMVGRAKACQKIVANFQRLATAVFEQAKKWHYKDASPLLVTTGRIAAMDIIPLICPAGGSVAAVAQFVEREKGSLLCPSGKVDARDCSLYQAALRESAEKLAIDTHQIKRCFPLQIFDDLADTTHGIISLAYVTTVEHTDELQSGAEKQGHELRIFSRAEFQALVEEEGKGIRKGHLLIRYALQQFLATHQGRLPSKPYLKCEHTYTAQEMHVFKQNSCYEKEKVISSHRLKCLSRQFESALDAIQALAAPTTTSYRSEWRAVGDAIFKPLTQLAQKILDGYLKADCHHLRHHRIHIVDALGMAVRFALPAREPLLVQVAHGETLTDAVARGALKYIQQRAALNFILERLKVTLVKMDIDAVKRCVVADFTLEGTYIQRASL